MGDNVRYWCMVGFDLIVLFDGAVFVGFVFDVVGRDGLWDGRVTIVED